MISKVSVRNFKCLREVDVDLEKFTVFVGPNASGKSSILQGMNHLCEAFAPEMGRSTRQIESDLSEASSRGATQPPVLAAIAGETAYRYVASPTTTSAARGESPSGRGVSPARSAEWKSWDRKNGTIPPLPTSVLLRLESSKLVQAETENQDPSVMSADGSGLHSALASMTLNDPDSWQALQDDLRRIIPTIKRLRHTKAAQMHQPTSVLFDTIGAESLPATQVSEGTLLVLGLLTVIHSPSRPNLILLDDLDRGLHPKAQKELITLLRGLLDSHPNLQIIATTHSPYMLDCMQVNEVRITFLKEDGSTVCAPLSSHPDFPKWKNEMTPGEMWSLFGEKWVAGDVAA